MEKSIKKQELIDVLVEQGITVETAKSVTEELYGPVQKDDIVIFVTSNVYAGEDCEEDNDYRVLSSDHEFDINENNEMNYVESCEGDLNIVLTANIISL